MTTTDRPIAPVLLGDATLYEKGFPHELFTDLRRRMPVCWSGEENGPGFWSLLRYDDISEAAKNPAVFSSATENGGHRIFDEQVAGVAGSGVDSPIGVPFISRDPPQHLQQRLALVPAIAPQRLKEMEARIRARIVRLFGALDTSGPFDVVKALSAPIAIKTLAELLEAPESREAKLVEWTNALIGEDDPEFRRSLEYMAQVIGELIGFASELRSARLGGSGADIITLISREKDGAEVPLPDFFANLILVLVGGNETTRNSISGGLVALAQHPMQWEKLHADPALIPAAVNEIVRWVSPVMHMRRTVMQDVTIRGQNIPEGSKILFWYPSANRDEGVWPNPFDFDVSRPVQRHLAFGVGQHVCIGSRLAEMQIRVFLEELIRRYRHIDIAGPVPRIRSNFIHGIKELPMRFEA